VPRFSVAWDDIAVKYCLQATPAVDGSLGAVVSLEIAPITSQSSVPTSTQQFGVDANMLEQIELETLPFDYARTATDPAILHLLYLLHAEIQAPQPASQLVVSSILTVLTTYLLQHWQAERNQN
jgi:hypothetical protein